MARLGSSRLPRRCNRKLPSGATMGRRWGGRRHNAPTTKVLAPVDVAQPETPTAQVIIGRWNELAAGTLLALAGPGAQILSGYLSIEVTPTSIVVTESLSEDDVVSELVVMSLGLTMDAADTHVVSGGARPGGEDSRN